MVANPTTENVDEVNKEWQMSIKINAAHRLTAALRAFGKVPVGQVFAVEDGTHYLKITDREMYNCIEVVHGKLSMEFATVKENDTTEPMPGFKLTCR